MLGVREHARLQIVKIKTSFHKSIKRVEDRHNTTFYKRLHMFVLAMELQQVVEEYCKTKRGVGNYKAACGYAQSYISTHCLLCASELEYCMIRGVAGDIHWGKLTLTKWRKRKKKV